MTISSVARQTYTPRNAPAAAPSTPAVHPGRSGLSTAETAKVAMNPANRGVEKVQQALADRQLGIGDGFGTSQSAMIGTQLNAFA